MAEDSEVAGPPQGGLVRVRIIPNQREVRSLWVDDLLEVDVDGDPAGYMVLSHIPASKLRQQMPLGIVDYIRTIKGRSNLRVSRQELPAALRKHTGLPPDASAGRVRRALLRMYGDDYRGFVAFHVDKPYVAYVRTYSEHEHFANTHKATPSSLRTLPRIRYQQQGLGRVLYQQAAIWLATKGMMLHADDNQSDDARAYWPKLAAHFGSAVSLDHYRADHPEQARCRLDGRLVGEDYLPGWAGRLEVVVMPQDSDIDHEHEHDGRAVSADASQVEAAPGPGGPGPGGPGL